MKPNMSVLVVILVMIFSPLVASDKRAITFEDFFSLKRAGTPQVSPDGKTVLFDVTIPEIEENTFRTVINKLDLEKGEVQEIGEGSSPVWAPDGKHLYFSRDNQLWRQSLDDTEAVQVTDFIAGASGPVFHPDGKQFLFRADVYPGCDTPECQDKKFEEVKNRKSSGRVIDKLLYRHWNSWREGKYSHVFLAKADGSVLKDITPGPYDTPPISLGSSHDYTFSPDGEEVCFVKNTDSIVAASTNNDLFIHSLKTGEEMRLTTNRGNDNHPVYSPDGQYIAYRSMERAGFEADRYRVMLFDRKKGSHKELTEGFTLSATSLLWHPSGKEIYFTADEEGTISLFSINIASGNISVVLKGHFIRSVSFISAEKLIFLKQTAGLPNELFTMDLKKRTPVQVTYLNKDILNQLELPAYETFWFTGANGEKVQGFLLKPPFFDPSKTYPAIELIHGGPQGAWGDDFHFRWNYQMFASPGYVVFMINFHGSTGYGQDFKDAVSKNWGGAPYEDIVLGTEYVLENYPFIDRNRLAAAGASYGGFMINWIAGHENPFQCLVSHDGTYEQVSMYGATEELWFPEWEFGGVPWENPELYAKWSPSRLAGNFKTPMLVIHGEHDYRVPYTQGLQLFTALQRQGVPSRLLFFPDEDHFVRKPQNARLWWKTVHDWIAQFTGSK